MSKPRVSIITPGTFGLEAERKSSVEQVVMELSTWINPYVHLQMIDRRPGNRGPSGYSKYVIQQLMRHQPQLIQIENRPGMLRHIKRHFPSSRLWLSLHSTTFISKPYIRQRQLAYQLRVAERIWVNSHYLKTYLSRLVPGAAHKISVNHLGVNLDQFVSRWSDEGEQLRQRTLNELGYSGKTIITYIGRLIPIKGVHHLLHALPQVVHLYPETIVLIIGSAFYGHDRLTPYVKQLHQLGNRLPRHVRFIPYVPHESIQSYFAASDVVVVPSNQKEAFGLVNIEAMASGIPVIATNAGGIREIVVDGVNGSLIDPHRMVQGISENLSVLLADPKKIKAMGMQAREHVSTYFTWRRTAERWLNYL